MKKIQIKLSEMKTIMTEMKNITGRNNTTLNTAEKKNSELEDIEMETTLYESREFFFKEKSIKSLGETLNTLICM